MITVKDMFWSGRDRVKRREGGEGYGEGGRPGDCRVIWLIITCDLSFPECARALAG